MPMTMVMTRDVAARYRGFLASVMPEIAPGVYVSPELSKGVRERIWRCGAGLVGNDARRRIRDGVAGQGGGWRIGDAVSWCAAGGFRRARWRAGGERGKRRRRESKDPCGKQGRVP